MTNSGKVYILTLLDGRFIGVAVAVAAAVARPGHARASAVLVARAAG